MAPMLHSVRSSRHISSPRMKPSLHHLPSMYSAADRPRVWRVHGPVRRPPGVPQANANGRSQNTSTISVCQLPLRGQCRRAYGTCVCLIRVSCRLANSCRLRALTSGDSTSTEHSGARRTIGGLRAAKWMLLSWPAEAGPGEGDGWLRRKTYWDASVGELAAFSWCPVTGELAPVGHCLMVWHGQEEEWSPTPASHPLSNDPATDRVLATGVHPRGWGADPLGAWKLYFQDFFR